MATLTGIGFFLVTAGWAVLEFIALARSTDAEQPYTFYIRKLIKRPGSIGWFLFFGAWLWGGCHFLLYPSVTC